MNVMVSKTPLRQVASVRELLSNESARNQLAAVAAAHMSPERMMRLLALAIDKTPNLDKCTPLSVLGALMTCSSLGLEANTVLGHAYLIPFRNNRKNCYEVQLVIGYRGFIALGHNSGQVEFIDSGVHYDDDPVWKYRKGSGPVLEHEPGAGKGAKLHAYAVCGIRGGGVVTVCWPWEKVIAHRDKHSKGWQQAVRNGKTADSPWTTAEDAMAMKTMIRQLTRFMPMSSERLTAAMEIDGARIDYAGFAMSPGVGLPAPEGGNVDPIEGEPEGDEDAGPAPAEQGAPAENPLRQKAPASAPTPAASSKGRAAAEAAREKAAAAARQTPAAATEEIEDDAPTVDVAAEIAAGHEARLRGHAGMICNDIADAPVGGVGNVLALWEPEIAEIKAIAPALWTEIEAELDARNAGGRE